MTKTFEEDFQGELEALIDGVLDNGISDSTFDGEKTKFIEKYAPQALPVVPWCVAEWYEEHKDDLDYSIYIFCTDFYKNTGCPGKEITKFENWFDNDSNQPIETLIRMKDGYTIEKPQLLYLKHIDMSKRDPDNSDWYLIKDHQIKGKEGLDHGRVHREETPEEEYFKFTQQEIDSMQTGSYEQIEVEK